MPPARGNQPMSSGSNRNMAKTAKDKPPVKNKKAPKKKLPKVARKAKVDNKQSGLINKLSKQVYKLQMASYGSVQMNLHTLDRDLTPTAAAPLCLDVTDFTCERIVNGVSVQDGARIFQANSTSSPYYGAVSKWKRSNYLQSNYYWKTQNQDQPDTGKYLCMNATYFVEVQGVDALDNTRIRFDLISQKPAGILNNNVSGASTPEANKVLPFTLNQMQYLAEPHINRINPLYFKKFFSKTIFINSQPTTESGVKATTANIQRFSFTLKPNKVMNQVLTNPIVGNVPIIDESTGAIGSQKEIVYGNYGPYNVSPTQPLWLLISTDDQVATLSDKVQIKMSRRIVWRDHIGSANL